MTKLVAGQWECLSLQGAVRVSLDPVVRALKHPSPSQQHRKNCLPHLLAALIYLLRFPRKPGRKTKRGKYEHDH